MLVQTQETDSALLTSRFNAPLTNNSIIGGTGLELTKELISRYNEEHETNMTLSIEILQPNTDSDKIVVEALITI